MAKKHIDPHEPILSTEVHFREPTQQDVVLDDHGRELVSPLPMEPALGYRAQPTIREQIREMVRSEQLRLEADRAGLETFEEADDFDVGDDYDPTSPYEEVFEPEELPGSPAPLPATTTASGAAPAAPEAGTQSPSEPTPPIPPAP